MRLNSLVPRNTPEYPGIPRNTPEYPGIPRNTPEYPGIPRPIEACLGAAFEVAKELYAEWHKKVRGMSGGTRGLDPGYEEIRGTRGLDPGYEEIRGDERIRSGGRGD